VSVLVQQPRGGQVPSYDCPPNVSCAGAHTLYVGVLLLC